MLDVLAVSLSGASAACGRSSRRWKRGTMTGTETLRKLQPGEKVDARWQIVKMVGEGGFGAVYEVKDTTNTSSGRNYALKVSGWPCVLEAFITV